MKKIFSLILALLLFSSFSLNAMSDSVYSYELKSRKDKNILANKAKATLIVNIATRCGYTGQLEGLEKIYKSYKDKGFVVIGIPSNDFGGQTPESEEGVAKFCKLNYGVSFPLSKKMVVKGEGKDPLIQYLIKKDNKEISWNFEKFLVDHNGKLIARFPSSVTPDSDSITLAVEKLLK